ncbi:MAG: EAL domain-containing protein [Rhodocyclaceae bacterium]|jgi:diguanylate cyclase (GGDEF)-like protein|nr:EAL domain-containing protein [Rhodocyclaceae bacterium]
MIKTPKFILRWRRALVRAAFRRQLTAYTTAGALLLALGISAAGSLRTGKEIRATLIEQGVRVAESLADQSRLALLSGAAENAQGAIHATLAFPDVEAVELRDASGRLLVRRGRDGQATVPRLETLAGEAPVGGEGQVEFEDGVAWVFLARVKTGPVSASPFDLAERPPDAELGLVRVVKSKATLRRLQAEVFTSNLALSLIFAGGFVILLSLLARRLTQPLNDLSAVMARAEAGESGARALLRGPQDIADMARAFNRMMDVLEQRERELVAARDDAMAFARLKAQFAATVSHEIRTPLNGVIGTLDMLLSSHLAPRQEQFAQIAWDSAQSLLDLVNNILDFSRLEAGKVEPEAHPVDLLALLEGVVDLVASQAHQKGLEVGCAVLGMESVPTLRGDARKIRQILINLLGNAVKFTEQGEAALRVQPVETRDGQLRLRFEVSDTGPGIPEGFEPRMFDSFSQADGSSTRRHPGSGLGLSICRQLAEVLGGRLGYEQAPGGGALFWLECTLDLAEAPALARAKPRAAPNLRVLVVEQSSIVADSLRANLERAGHQVLLYPGINEALAEQAATTGDKTAPRVDVALVDGRLVEQAGDEWERLQCCRTLASSLWVQLVSFQSRREGLPPPFTVSLNKPVHLARLLEILRPGTEALAPPPIESAAPGTSGAGSFRVLLAEDNRTNQAVTRGMVSLLGGTTVVATNGVEAVEAYRKQRWDLILMDCQMPEMDGFEATSLIRLREEETGARTPIVAMTANVSGTDVENCLAAGMDDHLAKPVTVDALRAKLQRWLPPYLAAHLGEGGELPTLQEPPQPAAPVDANVVARLRDALGGALGEAIVPFLEDAPLHIDAMRAALMDRNSGRLRQAAHVLKGAAGNLGAVGVARFAREVQDLAERGDFAGAEGVVARLTAEYERAVPMLRDLVGEASGVPQAAGLEQSVVLVVDDDRSTRSALRYALQLNGFVIHEAEDGRSALAVLDRIVPDVVLMDAMMPDMDGFTACAKVKELPMGQELPVLMITALDDRESIERAYAAGASDYITKPLHLNVVVQRVRRTIEAFRAQRHVRDLAYNDTLTGLPNRTMLTDHLAQRIEEARRSEAKLAVLFLDLDRFKYVNDTLGHEVGDHLLAAVAQRLRNCVRGGDCVARLGGDEFTVVLEDLADLPAASHVAQKIAAALAEPFHVEGHEIFVSASVGISVFPADGGDVSTLLRHADTAMYRAKRTSQSFRFYEPAMDAGLGDHLRLEAALRRALERQELMVHYQLEAETMTGRLFGAEALLRWQHPVRGAVSPVEFIPVAEETGLIVPIGEWVLETVCAQVRLWQMAGKDLSVSVNISGIQLQEPSFLNRVEDIIRRTGADPASLIFEITESVWMEQAAETLSTLHRLKGMGIRLAIDDFGTGYSSLAYIKRLPVDILKIDRSFIHDIATDAADGAIVRGIMALAHALQLSVVAEGVETEAQRHTLAVMGCDYLQGYLLGRPMPANDFASQALAPVQS